MWQLVAFEAGLGNRTSTGREFLSPAHKLLVVNLVESLQNLMRLEGHCLRLKMKVRSKMRTCPHFFLQFNVTHNF